MTRSPLLNNFIQKLGESWRRFWALPWRWKGPALGGAVVLVAVVIAVVTVAVASGAVTTTRPWFSGPQPQR